MLTRKLCFAVLLSIAGFGTSQAASEKSIMLVLDASGSMKAMLPDGTSRMDAAKSAVAQLVSTLPGDTSLAFQAYGHQSPQQQKNCKDSALLAPFDTVAKNKTVVIAKALSLQPQGYTPITYALTLAGEQLLSQEAASHIIVLVSDGKETCEADPCAAAKALAAANAKLVVHTIGAGVDDATRSQLQCISTAARGNYFDANSSVELATVVGQAAETRAVEMPEVKMPPKTAISQKSASGDEKAPTALEAGEIVKGRLGETGKSAGYHYWKVNVPAGRYRVVLDIKRSDDKHSNMQTDIEAFGAEGGKPTPVIKTNEIDYRTRAAAWMESTGQDVVLRVANGYGIVDYWLAIFPENAEITTPFFVRTPKILPLEFGKAVAGSLDPKPGDPAALWYSVALKAQDYKVTAEFKRTDGKKSNVQASVDLFGPIGEKSKEMPYPVCTVNEIDTGASCVVKLVSAQDSNVLIRVTPSNDSAYKTTFKIEPRED
jgi:hypothetical protein